MAPGFALARSSAMSASATRRSGSRPIDHAESRSSRKRHARRTTPSTSPGITTASSCLTVSRRRPARPTRCGSTAARLAGRRLAVSTEPHPHDRRESPAPADVRLLPVLGRRAGDRSDRIGPGRAWSVRPADGGADRRGWPDALLMLGDQVYADETSDDTAGSSARAATPAGRPATTSPTSRSTPISTRSHGATPTSAGSSRRCRRR